MKDIIIDNLTVSYGTNLVFKDLNLVIKNNEFNILKGVSGIGKTTLINSILGLIKYDGEIKNLPSKISMVFQEDRLIDEISIYHNLTLVNENLKLEEVKSLLEEIGLKGLASKKVAELSGGMKRRVAILRSVVYDSDFYILDEPFKGLDSDTKNKIISFIKDKLKDKTVLIVLHEQSEINEFKGHVIDLNEMIKKDK